MLTSQLCTQETLTSPAFVAWADRLRPGWDGSGAGPPVILHRKLWEWLFITQALAERGMLAPGRRGLAFGVGQEPLVAFFASLGCEVLATDLDPAGAAAAGWTDTGVEYAGGLEGLNLHGLCDPVSFAERVSFRALDMNEIPSDLTGFDFTWSSCAFEHLGSITRGQQFILNQMACLAPGGVAVHTTEYNVASNQETVEAGGTVIFRRRDLESLAARLSQEGHRVDCDFSEGTHPADVHVDAPPFSDVHLRLRLGDFVATSYGLIVERGERPPSPPRPPTLLGRASRAARAWLGRRSDPAPPEPGPAHRRDG